MFCYKLESKMICLNFANIIGESNNIIVCSLAKAYKTIPRKTILSWVLAHVNILCVGSLEWQIHYNSIHINSKIVPNLKQALLTIWQCCVGEPMLILYFGDKLFWQLSQWQINLISDSYHSLKV